MAAVSRQPFAPLDAARLQSLASLKNRQQENRQQETRHKENRHSEKAALPATGKRKAADADWENVDPQLLAKRSKGCSTASPCNAVGKPSALLLTTRPSAAAPQLPSLPVTKPAATKPAPASRRILQPRSPVARLRTSAARSSPVAAPAGRSPTRGRRSGILSSRRHSGPASYARVDPPSLGVGSPAPFSLDAALQGTIPGYGARPPAKSAASAASNPGVKASWVFDIHEDTPEQEMTNLFQHSTCVLDISSDEESEQRARRDKDEGRDKENMPPADDVSQLPARRRAAADAMAVDRERVALGEMKTADFYPEGCDESPVVLVPGDEDDEQPPGPLDADADADADACGADAVREVDLLMSASHASSKAAVLQPIEGTGESFELWESGSAKDETEP